MAKTMARLESDKVVNLEWVSDYVEETDTLKNTKDIPVSIGDTYTDGKFYRDGEEVLSYVDAAYKMVSEYESVLSEIENTVNPPAVPIGDEPEEIKPLPALPERKQAILATINDMKTALATLEVK